MVVVADLAVSYVYEEKEREEDMGTDATAYPHLTLDGQPLYVLTNQGCENTGYWTPEQFALLGLEYGEWNGESYPLTDGEATLISYKHVITPSGGELMFGYTALFQGQKWLMPSIEYMKPHRELAEERQTIEKLAAPYQGRVARESEGPEDRVTMLILVPMKVVEEAFGHARAWERYLERGMGVSPDDNAEDEEETLPEVPAFGSATVVNGKGEDVSTLS